MPVAETGANQRLFFALWPNAEVRAALQRLLQTTAARAYSGRPVVADNLHLTLAFVGTVPATRRPCLAQAAAQLRGQPFELCLDQLGYWPRPRVLWVGASQLPPALLELVSALNQALLPCAYRPDPRPYQAHVTLLRKARPPAGPATTSTPISPIHWSNSDFCLVESVSDPRGVQYQVRARWQLQPSAGKNIN